MRKIIYVAITFIICYLLNIHTAWLGFIPVFILISGFKIDGNFLWETPLALMVCDVLLIAFSEDINVLVYTVAIATTVLISIVSPKKLLFVFFTVIIAGTFKNTYTITALWATVWYGLRTAFSYFTTKRVNLQEHKL